MDRATLHKLVDRLPQGTLALAGRLLEAVWEEHDPLLLALRNAPVDEEPTSPQLEQALEEALEDVRAGRLIPDEQLWKELETEP